MTKVKSNYNKYNKKCYYNNNQSDLLIFYCYYEHLDTTIDFHSSDIPTFNIFLVNILFDNHRLVFVKKICILQQ